jgi:hypothetical protein
MGSYFPTVGQEQRSALHPIFHHHQLREPHPLPPLPLSRSVCCLSIWRHSYILWKYSTNLGNFILPTYFNSVNVFLQIGSMLLAFVAIFLCNRPSMWCVSIAHSTPCFFLVSLTLCFFLVSLTLYFFLVCHTMLRACASLCILCAGTVVWSSCSTMRVVVRVSAPSSVHTICFNGLCYCNCATKEPGVSIFVWKGGKGIEGITSTTAEV